MRSKVEIRAKPQSEMLPSREALAGVRATILEVVDYIEQSDSKIWFGVIVATLLIAQAALVLPLYWQTDLSAQFHGSPGYRQIAENVVTKGLYSLDGVHTTAYRPPLYPFLLAGLMSAFGQHWIFAAIILQSFLDILVGVLTVSISFVVFRSKAGASLAAFLYVIHLGFHLESVRQRETVLFTFLLMLFVHLLITERKNVLVYPALAVVSALAYLTRPTGFLFLPIFFLLMVYERENLKNRKRLLSLLVGGFLLAAITIPYHVHLYQQFSKISPFLPQSTNGWNLYQGNNPNTETIYPYVDVDLFNPWLERVLATEGIRDEFKGNQFLKDRAIDFILDRPFAFLQRAVVKLCALYSPIVTPLGTGTLVDRDGTIMVSNFKMDLWSRGTLKAMVGMFIATFTVILLVGAVPFFMRLGTWHASYGVRVLFIACPIVLVSIMHVITFAETRHRLPLDPLLIILASAHYSSRFQQWRPLSVKNLSSRHSLP
jgi:4-amino-4-deoxy-L-arabinose transferase-like glycosyltransferase